MVQFLKKPEVLAEMQACYYVDKVRKLKESLPRVRFDPLAQLKIIFGRWRPVQRIQKFVLKNVTESDVLKVIKNMRISHSYGHDLIDAATIKVGAKILAPLIKSCGQSLPGDRHLPN